MEYLVDSGLEGGGAAVDHGEAEVGVAAEEEYSRHISSSGLTDGAIAGISIQRIKD